MPSVEDQRLGERRAECSGARSYPFSRFDLAGRMTLQSTTG